jgi:hypothetical protein
MQTNKKLWVALIVVAIIAIGGYFFPQVKGLLGAVTPGTRFPHGITIGLPGNSPTNLGDVKVGSCSLLGADVSQAATTTASYDCAVTGVISTDLVTSFMLSTSTQNTSLLNWSVMGARASTTAGFITVRLTNLTGTAATPSVTAVGSSTVYTVVKTQ